MAKRVTPPPRLPHPPAVAFATPTIRFENIWVHQTWQATKEASPMPMTNRHAMNPAAFVTNIMPKMAGAVMRRTNARPLRAPILSQTMPIRKRQMMLDVTLIRFPMASSVRFSPSVVLFFSTGASGAGAKVLKNVAKNPNHEAWKACMCGRPKVQRGSLVALCCAPRRERPEGKSALGQRARGAGCGLGGPRCRRAL